MCYCVYIATTEPLGVGEFIPNETLLYFQQPDEEEISNLKSKFKNPYIYHVGSDTCCSCGLDFYSDQIDNPDWTNDRDSPQRFLDFIQERVQKEELEYYCCWAGDTEADPEEYMELDAGTIFLDKNYFGLNERQFIKFKQQ